MPDRKESSLRAQVKPVFEERFKEMLGNEEEYESFISSILVPQRKSFRINSLKVEDSNKLVKDLEDKEISLTSVPWAENAYFVDYEEGKRTDLGNLYEHFLGKIYIQEATSMLPPLLLDIPEYIDKEFKVLDMAASPGSKTTQTGIMMKNQGVLVANEVDYRRLGALKGNLERTGLTNVVITNQDGERVEGEELYDRIILDAPCSGSGVIRKSPKTLKFYNPKKLKSLRKIQLRLLQRAFELLKEEGIMTYSTCSLDPEEDEAVIDEFLKKNEGYIELEDANLEGVEGVGALKDFKGQEFSKEVSEKTMRVWPHYNDTNGFYVAKLRKVKRN